MQLTISNSKKLIQTNSLSESIIKADRKIKAMEGDVLRIKIVDYLGDGKLIVDLKGQRIVAHSNLMIEADQEIDVIIKSMDNNRIILQVLSEDQSKGGLQTESDGLSCRIDSGQQFNNSQNVYFEIPVFFDDQEANSLIGFNDQPDKQTRNLLIAVELKNLGYMEFTVNIVDFNLNCHILSEDKNTCKLAQQFSSELKECLSKLGYKVENITCLLIKSPNAQYPANYFDVSV